MRLLTTLGRDEEARRAQFRAQISLRDREAISEQIDLSPFYNATLDEDWTDPAHKGSNLSRVPRGLVTLPGTDDLRFDLRGIVQLKSRRVQHGKDYPEKIIGIPVGQAPPITSTF